MRPIRLALLGLLLGTAVQAQPAAPPTQPAPPAQAPPADNSRLDQMLARWEKEMGTIQSLATEMTRTTVDKTWGTTETYVGRAKYVKPNLALLEMQKKDNPQVFEKYLCTGTFLYQYVPASKAIHVHELPPPRPGQAPGDDNFLSFLFGMKAEEAKKRYDLKLVKEDQWYVYIEVTPKLAVDKSDFQKARLVLNQSNFLPRQIWFEQPNGNEISWDLPKAQSGVQIDRNEFAPPQQAPAGWTMVRVPRAEAAPNPNNNAKPTVVRPNDK
ncbi:MAG: TIGR03009 domain-containing protein [Planctomycetia bacterium]|nr:TIGR03009 domain-containing protein [Planctomycetia bacterium]